MPKDLAIPFDNPGLIPSAEERVITQRTVASFIPAVKLIQGTSREIKQENTNAGDFMYQGINLGPKVKIIIVDRRPHAILFESNKNVLESFDPESDTWQEIASTTRNFKDGIDPSHGQEWLMYLCNIGEFAAMICGKAATKPMTDDFIDHMTPPNDRKKAAKDLPHTRYFEMWSYFEDTKWGSQNKSHACRATGLIADSEDSLSALGITPPIPSQVENAMRIFQAPLNQAEPAITTAPER